MAQLRDQDPETWAVLKRVYADADRLFAPKVPLPHHVSLIRAIQRFLLSKHPRRAEVDEVARAIARSFPRTPSLQLRKEVRHALARKTHFDGHDSRYGVITSSASKRQVAARRFGVPTWTLESDHLTPIEFIQPTTHDPEAGSNAKTGTHADLWNSWFARLGTAAAYCHLRLTLDPSDPRRHSPRTFGVILLAGLEPSWLIYTLTNPDDLTKELLRRQWSTWMPHDHPGFRAQEYTAPPGWVSDPINQIVIGAHVHTPQNAWTEFIALCSDVMDVDLDRVDPRWEPMDEDHLHRLERTRHLLVDAFTWVSQRTAGGVYAADRYRSANRDDVLDTCMICGRDLRDEQSADLRIGPVCQKRALERIGDALDLTDTWRDAEELLERMARSRRVIPTSHWAYARRLIFPSSGLLQE